MLGKCANPVCLASFRKLGTGKLFAFQVGMNARSAEISSIPGSTRTGQTPAFFWLCEACSLTFTVGLDTAGKLALHRICDGASATIFDRYPLGAG
jgi:hypothetical protein